MVADTTEKIDKPAKVTPRTVLYEELVFYRDRANLLLLKIEEELKEPEDNKDLEEAAILNDFVLNFLDHPVVDGNTMVESNLLHFNFLKSFEHFLDNSSDLI